MNTELKIFTYHFAPIDSNMYLIMQNNSALLIDPCISEEVLDNMRKNNINNVMIILTHEHYDHISGVNWMRGKIKNVKVYCSDKCSKLIVNSHKNLAAYLFAIFRERELETWQLDYVCEADATFDGEITINWENHELYLKETKGHSLGSICVLVDNKYLFCGDSLISGTSVITRLPGGSRLMYNEETLPFLRSLNGEVWVFPGHGEMQKLRDFKLDSI